MQSFVTVKRVLHLIIIFVFTLLLSGCGKDFKLGNWHIADDETSAVTEGDIIGDGFLVDMQGVAVFGQSIYATDPVSDLVAKFDSSKIDEAGEEVWEVGGNGTGELEFDAPGDVAVDGDGFVYVADTGNGRIQKLASDGSFADEWNDGLNTPFGLTVDAQGFVFVADKTLSKIFKFTSTGIPQGEFGGEPGSANGSLLNPTDVAVDLNGNIYVVNTANDRIEVFDSAGNYLRRFGTSGSDDGQFLDPFAIEILGTRVYVTDRNLGRISRFDLDGNYIDKVDSFDDTAINNPEGVAVEGSWLYIAESGTASILRISLSEFK